MPTRAARPPPPVAGRLGRFNEVEDAVAGAGEEVEDAGAGAGEEVGEDGAGAVADEEGASSEVGEVLKIEVKKI